MNPTLIQIIGTTLFALAVVHTLGKGSTGADVPGGTTAYMMQEVIENQGGYYHLDSEPRTLTGKPHRPAYGSDGDYWSKPNAETVFDAVYEMMNEVDPERYPVIK